MDYVGSLSEAMRSNASTYKLILEASASRHGRLGGYVVAEYGGQYNWIGVGWVGGVLVKSKSGECDPAAKRETAVFAMDQGVSRDIRTLDTLDTLETSGCRRVLSTWKVHTRAHNSTKCCESMCAFSHAYRRILTII